MTVQSISRLVYEELKGDAELLNNFQYFDDRGSGNVIDKLLNEAFKHIDKDWTDNKIKGIETECSIEPLSFPTKIVLENEVEDEGNLVYWKEIVGEHLDFDCEFSQSDLEDLMKLAYDSDLDNFFENEFDESLNDFFDVDFYRGVAREIIEGIDFYSIVEKPFKEVKKEKQVNMNMKDRKL